jgi:hypothetical protein
MAEEIAAPARASFSDILSGMLNVFIDPDATAKQVVKKGFWIWPLLVTIVVTAALGYLLVPSILRVMQLNPPPNVTREQLAQPVFRTFVYLSAVIFPVVGTFVVVLLSAWLTSVTCTVMGIQAKFGALFSLVSATTLISLLEAMAGFVVVKMKGDDLQSMQEFQSPFGLDIFLSGVKGPLLAFLHYFSIFRIWYIVMLALILATMTRIPKGKAFVATVPAWLVPLLFAVVISFFQPST